MNQQPLEHDRNEQLKREGKFDEAFAATPNTFAGFNYDFTQRNTLDDTPEEREKFYHKLLIEDGGFKFWLNTYKDMLYVEDANMEVSDEGSTTANSTPLTHHAGLQVLERFCSFTHK